MLIPVEDLYQAIQSGDRYALSRAITLVESNRSDDRVASMKLMTWCESNPGTASSIAIAGAPGVGKSTFIEAFGLRQIQVGKKVAVLSIDPSSIKTQGSILGDKTRMETLSQQHDAFVRPSPNQASSGGLNDHTRESILLCAAAGYEVILIETVGVGQSELDARHVADMMILLLQPGAGDDIQGMKKGIVELADLLVVNKGDGDLLPIASEMASQYQHSLQTSPWGWSPKIEIVSSLHQRGFERIDQIVADYLQQSFINQLRRDNHVFWLKRRIKDEIERQVMTAIARPLKVVEEEVRSGRSTPFAALQRLSEIISNTINQ